MLRNGCKWLCLRLAAANIRIWGMAAPVLHLSYKTLINGIGTVNGSNTDFSHFTNTCSVVGNLYHDYSMTRLLMLKPKMSLNWLLVLLLLVSGCYNVPSPEYKTRLDRIPQFLRNHFPPDIQDHVQASLITNTDTTSHCVYYLLMQFGDSPVNEFEAINKANSVLAQYEATDTSIISVKRETVTYWKPEKKKYYTNKTQNEKYYYPVPYFETEDHLLYKGDAKDIYSEETQSGLAKDFVIYVYDFKTGKYWNGLNPLDYMPKGWENGYSKGVAVSKSKSVVIYWFLVW